ncbi:MAG TPA: APC family permease [Candidatus Tumulicola sp.]|nr:APC family permease [Candidatus Tumulicola sp.]
MNASPTLRAGSLTFVEVLATSIALIGPSMTPILIAPYMFANAGNGTWLAYAFGGTMLAFVALNINQFARRSSAAGSMYGYVAENLGPGAGAIAGWSLLWAYVFVAAAVLGAMALFVDILLGDAGLHAPPIAIVCAIAIVAWQAAYRGVQVSAVVMLVLEAISVAVICVLVGIVLVKHGASIDVAQLKIQGGFPGGLGLAIMFAVFSFVGFESATAFGAEAKRPLIAIPRAVIGSVLFVSVFFIVATYAEILGLRHAALSLDKQTFPLGTLAAISDVGYLQIPIAIGALCSAFSVCLACITTGGRVAYAMAGAGVLPAPMSRIEPKHDTPNVAVTVVTACTLVVAAAALLGRVAPIDVFDNCGTLSSFGFLVIYALISIAAGVFVKRRGELRARDFAVCALAIALLLVPTVMLFYSIPAPPQRWFVFYFIAFLLAGRLWFAARAQRSRPRAGSLP